MAVKKTATFFDLPAELRNLIYGLVVIEDNVIEPNPWECFSGCAFYNEHRRDARDHQPAITKTCRQIRNEALPILYSSNTFSSGTLTHTRDGSFGHYCPRSRHVWTIDHCKSIDCLDAIGCNNLRHIHKLHLRGKIQQDHLWASFDIPLHQDLQRGKLELDDGEGAEPVEIYHDGESRLADFREPLDVLLPGLAQREVEPGLSSANIKVIVHFLLDMERKSRYG